MSDAVKTTQPKTIPVFCAKCQDYTANTKEADLNGELLFTCTNCGGFIKLPAPRLSGMSAQDVKDYLELHKEHNVGQVSIQDSQDVLDELDSLFGDKPKDKTPKK